MSHGSKQRGFGNVEGLLIIIVVLLVGFIGYYVYNARQNTNNTPVHATVNNVKTSPSQKATKAAGPVVPAGWQKYDAGGFSFSNPENWIRKNCGVGTILLGPTANSAGLCNTDGNPEVSITWSIGDSRANYHLAKADYPDLQEATVEISGVTATKTTGTLNSSQEIYVGPSNGTKVIQYLFYTKGQTYAFIYTQTPDFGDVSSDFEQLVNKTLSFN
jgi:hypothetical protein